MRIWIITAGLLFIVAQGMGFAGRSGTKDSRGLAWGMEPAFAASFTSFRWPEKASGMEHGMGQWGRMLGRMLIKKLSLSIRIKYGLKLRSTLQ
ncbi:MAG: hypothetical protein U5L72_01665 [Bacteroidales bacterium]|nr:hypothetical protein [Bacteroidales bacterium]